MDFYDKLWLLLNRNVIYVHLRRFTIIRTVSKYLLVMIFIYYTHQLILATYLYGHEMDEDTIR